jgi:hypothetical protein
VRKAAQQAVAADTLRFGRFAPSAPRAAEPRVVSPLVASRAAIAKKE